MPQLLDRNHHRNRGENNGFNAGNPSCCHSACSNHTWDLDREDAVKKIQVLAHALNYRIYSVSNTTKGICIADRAEGAETIFKRMKGLLGRSAQDFQHGCGLWIFPSEGIHTFGMSFPIDALYLDSGGRVIQLYKNLLPNRLGALKLRVQSVLELPAGTLDRTRTEIGDIIEFHMHLAENNE